MATTVTYQNTMDANPAACVIASRLLLSYVCGSYDTTLDEFARYVFWGKTGLDSKFQGFTKQSLKDKYSIVDVFRSETSRKASESLAKVIRPSLILAGADTNEVEMEQRVVTTFNVTTTTALVALPVNSPVTAGVSVTVTDARPIRVGSWIIIRNGTTSELAYVEAVNTTTNVLTITRNPGGKTTAFPAMAIGSNVDPAAPSKSLRGNCDATEDCATYVADNCCVNIKTSKIGDCMTFPSFFKNESKMVLGAEKTRDRVIRQEFRRMFAAMNETILSSEYITQTLGGQEVVTVKGWDEWSKEFSSHNIADACCAASWIGALNVIIQKANENQTILESGNRNVIVFLSASNMDGLTNIQDNRISLRRDTNSLKDTLDRNGLRLFAELTEVPLMLTYKGFNFYFIESQHLTDFFPTEVRVMFDETVKVITRDEMERVNPFNLDVKGKVGGLFKLYTVQNPEKLQNESCDMKVNWEMNIQLWITCPEVNWKIVTGPCNNAC